MAELKPVDFKVTSIEPGDAKGFVKIDVVFDGNSKVYNYYRKSVAESDNMYVIISGCKVQKVFLKQKAGHLSLRKSLGKRLT